MDAHCIVLLVIGAASLVSSGLVILYHERSSGHGERRRL